MSEKYITWKARHFDKGPTHYKNDYVADAMKILYESRHEIQNSIFEFTETNNRWQEILGCNLIDKFTVDNPTFLRSKINYTYLEPASFFFDLSQLVDDILYAEKLKRTTKMPIKPENFRNGWLAIIGEFGLFYPLSGYFDDLKKKIRTSKDLYQSNQLQQIIDEVFPDFVFEENDIKCPAITQVKKHFAICVTVNIGLVKTKIYSESTRINLLKDGTNHFRKPEDMITEYEGKIATR